LEGGLFLRSWWQTYDPRTLPRSWDQLIQSWDLAFKGKPTSDFVVGQVWCQYEGRLYIVDQVREQIGYRGTKQLIVDLAARYPWIGEHIIEDAANAAAIDDDLQGSIPGLRLVPHGGGVLARTQQVEGLWAAGSVILPESAPWLGGSEGFVAEHLAFDGLGLRHDDQVSASSLALLHLHGSPSRRRWVDAMKSIARSG
jgi:predicted phage terminase large subunit-like protein